MRAYTYSVQRILVLLVGLLGVLAVLLAAIGLRYSLRANERAQRMAASDRIARQCLAAAKDFSFERGRTTVVLHGPDPISDVNQAFLLSRRAGANRAMEALRQALGGLSQALDPESAEVWEAVRRLRMENDRDFSLPLPSRDPTLPDRWLQASTALIERLEFILARFSYAPGEESNYGLMCETRVLVLRFRNAVGQASSRIASEMATPGGFGIQTLGEVYLLRGRAQQLWEQLGQVAGLLGNAAFSQALDKVDRLYFGETRALQDRILAAGLAGLPPPVTAEQYTAATVRSLDHILDALDAIDQAIGEFSVQLMEEARRLRLWTTAAIAAALALVGMAVSVSILRITRPLRAIASRIEGLGSRCVLPEAGAGGDEFTMIRKALDMLDDSMKANERDARELKLANQRLAELAVTDELTGLANRRRFNEAYGREWARARRNTRPLAVFMIDIDWFKAYNDRYGHQAGDECLAAVACVLRAMMKRPGDIVARYGGEEFVVVASDTDMGRALSLAERLRGAVEALDLPHADSPHARVTLSIGVAVSGFRGAGSADTLLREADNGLYRAKEKGRNRVETLAAPLPV